MAGTSGVLRMSGMNSGFDTEAMVNAMTATTKLKITESSRKVLKLQATQEAYRDIIGKMTTFQNKYFDVLNTSSYLKGSSIFNQYSAKITQGTEEKTPAGVSVTCSSNATAGDYDVKVNSTATQATMTSSALGANIDLQLDTLQSGKTYSMNVTVGSTTKTVTFDSGANRDELVENLNTALQTFGKTNSTSASDPRGLVYVDSNGLLNSGSKTSITTTGIYEQKTADVLDTAQAGTGKTTINITVGDVTKSVTVSTFEQGYFDSILDGDGKLLSNAADIDEDLTDEYNTMMSDLYDAAAGEDYNTWLESASDDDKTALFNDAYEAAKNEKYSAAYDKEMAAQKKGAYEAAKSTAYADYCDANGYSTNSEDANYLAIDDFSYTSLEDFSYTDEEFQATNAFAEFDEGYTELSESSFKSSYSEQDAYKDLVFSTNVMTEDEFKAATTASAAITDYNQMSIANSVGNIKFTDGTTVNAAVNADGTVGITAEKDGAAVSFGMTIGKDSAGTLGSSQTATSSTIITSSTKLSELGLTADSDGNYGFEINGKSFSFAASTTIKDMMKTVNASDAGVKMSFTSLTNQFTLTSNDYGIDATISYADGSSGILNALGFGDDATFTEGKNLNLTVNGQTVEAQSNSYEFDGIKMTFSSGSEGAEFTATVDRDYSDALTAIKSFVTDYNQMIADVYKYIDQKPDSDYYFLTDDDIDEMELSETQQEKWETKAKQGLLYNDSAVSSVMSQMRTALYAGVTGTDGKTFGVYSMGITSSTDWTSNGKLVLDEKALTEALKTNADDISELFTNSTNGIMTQFDKILDGAVKSTGARVDKGTLVQKAGLASGTSATDNSIYDQIKDLKSRISTLKDRYDEQQDRYWKIYSAMETQLGELNNQTSSISQLLGS